MSLFTKVTAKLFIFKANHMNDETKSKNCSLRIFSASFWGPVLAAIILASGFVCAVKRFKDADRVVVVRGLAEKDVEANLVIWSITWTVTSNDLKELSQTLTRQSREIQGYLRGRKIAANEIEVRPAGIRDLTADSYNQQQLAFRYSAKGNLAVKTSNVAGVKAALAGMDQLLAKGIVFGDSGYITMPEYSYTDLNKIKPEMIAAATKNAREAAQKFAQDSDSKPGKIKRATQGLFEIFSRDALTPEQKTVRVVTTVEYSLED